MSTVPVIQDEQPTTAIPRHWEARANPQCKYCKHSILYIEVGERRCHRFPPYSEGFPTVKDTDRCGEWELARAVN
jgi:hypothetical protein